MSVLQLIYRSEANFYFSDDDLIALLQRARRHNAEKNITGLLLYGYGNFMQILEGNEERVRDLYYTRISKDKRHSNAVILHQAFAPKRLFKDWSMAFRPLNLEQVRDLKGFTSPDQQPQEGKDVLSPLRYVELMQRFALNMQGK